MANTDINKAIKQHLEIDEFLVGDFTLKGQVPEIIEKFYASPGKDEGASTDSFEQLEAISRHVSQCSLCSELASTRKNVVAGEGNPRARLVFVGEAPGGDEDEQGRPFVGRAGKLLTKIISAMGLERKDVFICNTLKCRPPGNRDPRPEEKKNCWPFLRQQLEIIQPEIIVALGSHAARTLLDVNLPIGRLRGRFHEYYYSPDMSPVKLMPTYHPAYLLRNYSADNRRRVWEDMMMVMKELGLKVPDKKKGS